MTAETLFDAPHTCRGPWCRYCETRGGVEAAAAGIDAMVKDAEWVDRATNWLNQLPSMVLITADKLTRDIGLPTGTGNQVGAIFRKWHTAKIIGPVGFTTSERVSNHGRVLREWRKL